MGENVKEALANIKVAAEAGDEASLDSYAMDDRVSVSKAAQKALDAIDGLDNTEGANAQEELKKEKEEPNLEGWVCATNEEAQGYRDQGILVGHNPSSGMVLLKS